MWTDKDEQELKIAIVWYKYYKAMQEAERKRTMEKNQK